tara:strand:+ start:2847 stop:4523 length:1677 start_codon:yes stop_codon:yes gene_type:complete
MTEDKKASKNFIEEIIEDDLKNGLHKGKIHTRFPPEPNGYLHIGHAKAICLNFGIAQTYNGKTNLRFDDTNPLTEDTSYVDAIKKDVKWLGFEWANECYASDYFSQLYEFAQKLISNDLAFIDESSVDEIAEQKGTPTSSGKESPFRNRPKEESLQLFEDMKNGKVEDGDMVLRAKIDMESPNMHMRDPVIYRVKKATHHRTGDDWCIYPMYDFAHGQSDSIEGITHSLCSLEFIHHRPLYDWFIENLGIFPSKQTEFARLNVSYMITSKRKLLKLVQEGLVDNWDDPRMSTISGMRRRGYPAAAIRTFCDKVGIAKRENLIDIALLESCVRDELNKTATRAMAVLDPIKVVITNFPQDKTEILSAVDNPEEENSKSHDMPFSREIFIEKGDFMVDPPKKFFRLGPDRSVRLKNAYIITCESYELDENGEVKEVRCIYHQNSKSGSDTSGIKAKGTLHWVSINHAFYADVEEYDRLFTEEVPDGHEDKEFLEFFNENSKITLKDVPMEPFLKDAKPGDQYQFMRKGYFVCDQESSENRKVFNKTVGLRDTWAKKQKKN